MEENKIQMICKLPNAVSLQELCDLTYRILGNPVFLTDMVHTQLSHTKCVTVDDPVWIENVEEENLSRNMLRQDRQVTTVHIDSSSTRHAVIVDDDFIPYPRIIKTLIHNGQPVGVMVVTAYFKPFQESDTELTDLIASFVVPLLMKEHYHISGGASSVENYFIKLLGESEISRDAIVRHMQAIGYPYYPYHYLLTLCAQDHTDTLSGTIPQIEQDIASIPHCTCFLYDTSLIVIYGSEQPVTDWDAQVPDLLHCMNTWKLFAGVSRTIQEPEHLRNYYLQARAILETGRKLERRHLFYVYDELSSFLLFSRIPPQELNTYCHQKIQELAAYDRTHNTDLCSTLQVYLEQAKSLSKASEILFIHRNTVRYRILRCMELLNSSLDNGNEIFSFILSLRILEYQGKILHFLPAQTPERTRDKI